MAGASDGTGKFQPPCYLNASLASRVTQWYLNPLFREGYKRQLELEDVPAVLPWDESSYLGPKLQRAWSQEEARRKPNLAWTILRTFRRPILLYGIMFFCVEAIAMCQPFLINLLLDYFQGREVSKTMAYIYGSLVAVCGIVFAFPAVAGAHLAWSVGMRARAATGALVFRKVMSMEMGSLRKTPSGDILNHMATDVEKFSMGALLIHFLWLGPLQAVAVGSVLLLDFGLAFLAGIGVLGVIIVVQQITSRIYGRFRLKIASFTDKRTHLMYDIIAGMRVIKMYCWEDPYTETVADVRREEIRRGIQAGLLESTNYTFSLLSTKIIAMVTIVTYVMTGNDLTPHKVFKLVAWLEILRYSMFYGCTMSMLMGSQAYYSALRIQRFLSSDEHTDDRHIKAAQGSGGGILLQGVSASWPVCHQIIRNDSHHTHAHAETVPVPLAFSLRQLDLHIKQGELVACAGPVGSGKSSLLSAILGQMPVSAGSIMITGKVAYVPQEAWIFSGTFRDNVLFGCPMEQARYEETLSVCALTADIEQMPGGDMTLVGERGLSLSGGQKARVNLARAVYRDADIYLLDDPLSAVDTKVGKHLFQKCITKHLAGKTRLLVTHQQQYLKQVDHIIVLHEGGVMASGTYEALDTQVDFSSLLAKKEPKKEPSLKEENQLRRSFLSRSNRGSVRRSTRSRKVSTVSQAVTELSSAGDCDMEATLAEDATELDEEERLKGAVGLDVYRQYLKAGPGPLVFMTFVLFAVSSKALYILVDWWLTKWANCYKEDYARLHNVSDVQGSFLTSESREYLIIYVILVLALFLAATIETATFVIFTRVAARNLHDNMFHKVMRAPLVFFERNPVGRILNRFSRDMIFMDEILPQSANIVVMDLMVSLAVIIFVCFVNFWALVFTVPMVIVILAVRQYGTYTTRNVKRIEALNRSPVYSHVAATLQGMSVIRAFKMEDLMTKQFDQLQDKHTASWLAFFSCNRWIGVRLDFITGVYLATIVFISLALADQLDGTLVSLSLAYIFSMLGRLQSVVRKTAEVESYMTSVERILQYTNVEQEALPHSGDVTLPPNWPSQGAITFDHMTVTYFEDSPPALSDICLAIKGGEKIGVVGRTAAGKTSLIAALMRLVEPTGSIWIDGVDVTTIGLADLRRNISIIPQDPVLFTGTLRMNLDPFGEYTDDQIWQAIEEVQLKEKAHQFPGELYGDIAEAGANFSVGQKQLVCLARALLRQNNILLIDEATANVDQGTDDLVQKTIREKFKDCTVLTVAHRLNTIMDSDKVLVLELGEVKQYDHPYILLQDEEGLFYDMVQHTGRHYANRLTTSAQNHYNKSSVQRTQCLDGDRTSTVSKTCQDIQNSFSQEAHVTDHLGDNNTFDNMAFDLNEDA